VRVVLALLACAGVGVGAYFAARAIDEDGGEPTTTTTTAAAAPPVIVHEQAPEQAQDLGFPAFATNNTTRVSGDDPIANAAGVALAVYPSGAAGERPAAVSLVDSRDWAGGIAAASLAGPPVGAPILLTEGKQTPQLTEDALSELAPRGSAQTEHHQVFTIGQTSAPPGLRALSAEGAAPATVASAVDRLRQRLVGDPDQILVAALDRPEYALPAAAWAARSGDPVLFVHRDSIPRATVEALGRHRGVPIYVLGPASVVSEKTLAQLRKLDPAAKRVGTEGAVENAIAFARYSDAGFGWNINDPGHGFVIANVEHPLDAAAAAPLSASGTWGPLLVTDDSRSVPAPLRTYLLDLKPGYTSDPTRALYNHVWLIGDPKAISVGFQAEVDRLAELAKVRSGSGASFLETGPGAPEPEQRPDSKR
jgi:hypothetical protein